MKRSDSRIQVVVAVVVLASSIGASGPSPRKPRGPGANPAGVGVNTPVTLSEPERSRPQPQARPATTPMPTAAPAPAPATPSPGAVAPSWINPDQALKSVSTVGLVAVASLAPAAVLMLTAFVRINIVLVLLRQALGSPQVPGNQVLSVLALLLTALVMRPVGESVHARAIAPYTRHEIGLTEACQAASRPVKAFMLEQIERTNHGEYLWKVYDEVAPAGQADPKTADDCPFGVVATAYLLSELTTALVIGFYLYLPFLVVDLVVSAVLAAMGLFMLPPSLVSLPLKLMLFVVVDGWLHVATMLLRSFGPVATSP